LNFRGKLGVARGGTMEERIGYSWFGMSTF
jgi:hypothetical protein